MIINMIVVILILLVGIIFSILQYKKTDSSVVVVAAIIATISLGVVSSFITDAVKQAILDLNTSFIPSPDITDESGTDPIEETPSSGIDIDGETHKTDTESETENSQSSGSQSNHAPFYGVWCGATRTEAEAQEQAEIVRGDGFEAQIFVTTDWSNLNPIKCYGIAAGVYPSEYEATVALPSIKEIYPDAYIKYSGNWQGRE